VKWGEKKKKEKNKAHTKQKKKRLNPTEEKRGPKGTPLRPVRERGPKGGNGRDLLGSEGGGGLGKGNRKGNGDQKPKTVAVKREKNQGKLAGMKERKKK